MRSVTIITLIMLLFCTISIAFATPAENTSILTDEATIPELEMAPLNPAFIEYMEKLEENDNEQAFLIPSSLSNEGSSNQKYPVSGMIPSPIDNSNIDRTYSTNANEIGLLSASEDPLPAYYDLRNENRVTPVKNQATSGSCWAFATYASLESCMIPEDGFYDFSENHMKNLISDKYSEGFDSAPNNGGNLIVALAYLSRWSGPVNESDDPYNDTSIYSNTSIPERKHIQEVMFLPYRDYEISHDDDFLKYAIMEYGAVYSSFHVNRTGFDDKYLTYYYNETNYVGGHGVALIGWNDTYPKENFNITPPEDGAFICKNSWSTSVGDEGYFYISYYEPTFNTKADQVAVFVGAEDVDNYDNIYQYDPLGLTNHFGFNSIPVNISWAANVFTSNSKEYLNAVSFYTTDEMTDYEIYIYKNPDQGPVNSTKLSYNTSGTLEYAGYHTIDLTDPVTVEKDQRFSVVIKFSDPDYQYLIATEKPIPNFSSKATANPGEGYVSPDGREWFDPTDDNDNSSICIKAFTDDPQVISIAIEPINDSTYAGETLQFNSDAFDQYNYPINASLIWNSKNESVGTIDPTTGLFTAINTGNTTISVTNGSVTNSTKVTVLERPAFTIKMHEPQDGFKYNSDTTFLNVSANLKVDTWMYNINYTGNHTFIPNTTLPLSDGNYNITIFANDTIGNMASDMVNFTIDTKAPVVTIDHPDSMIYSTTSVELNVSADEDVDTWTYNINNTGNNNFTPNTTLELPDGKHNITVFARDLAGNIGSASVNFTIDLPTETTRKSSSSSSGGGGSGNTGESFENIALKEVKTIHINKDSEIIYQFGEEGDEIEYVGFSSLKNSGKISVTIEVLNGRSALVKDNPPGLAYQHMNIWVGKAGFASEENIEDPVIGFRVSRSWINENNIDRDTIALYRNHDEEWTNLPTAILREDDHYIYFEAKTPGFSPFVITGSPEKAKDTETGPETDDPDPGINIPEPAGETSSENMSLLFLPNGIVVTIFGCAYLVLRKRS